MLEYPISVAFGILTQQYCSIRIDWATLYTEYSKFSALYYLKDNYSDMYLYVHSWNACLLLSIDKHYCQNDVYWQYTCLCYNAVQLGWALFAVGSVDVVCCKGGRNLAVLGFQVRKNLSRIPDEENYGELRPRGQLAGLPPMVFCSGHYAFLLVGCLYTMFHGRGRDRLEFPLSRYSRLRDDLPAHWPIITSWNILWK